MALLDPGAGKTRRAYVWAYTRGELDAQRGVVYEFCAGRGVQYPLAFLAGWSGTLVCDQYAGYGAALDPRAFPQRLAAACLAHARRKFDELLKSATSQIAAEAVERIARIYRLEGQLAEMTPEERQAARNQLARPLWDELKIWLEL